MAKLVWSKTGDEISLVPFNPELYSYFVEQINASKCNSFLSNNLDFSTEFDTLKSNIANINKILTQRFNITDLDFGELNFLDQTVLNDVHRAWVKLHQQFPNIGIICEKIEEGTNIKFYQINKIVHKLEGQFDRLELVCGGDPIPNIFGTDCLIYGRTNIMIEYNNLGRSTYNKWLNFDKTVADTDTNDFKELYTALSVNLSRPLYRQPPQEYVDWCAKFGIAPVAENVGLANFDKLEENLLSYRTMFYNNAQQFNFITFED